MKIQIKELDGDMVVIALAEISTVYPEDDALYYLTDAGEVACVLSSAVPILPPAPPLAEPGPGVKTESELDDLKRQWLAEPHWEIEHTEGFEAYRNELKIFAIEQELIWFKEHLAALEVPHV